MLSIIKENLLRKDLILESKPILCAVSGGIDSMVMLDCLRKLKVEFAVAHIDHNTREGQSKSDLEFVKSQCQEQNIKFHSTVFNESNQTLGNFQEKARNFRYQFFKELLAKNNYIYVATAHHLNDDFETFIINLSRGTGLKGLTGIPFENDLVIRPLNGISKTQILSYAKENKIEFVADISNESDDYLRNKVRHHVIPSIDGLNQNALLGFQSTLSHLKNTSDLLNKLVNEKYISRSKFNNLLVSKYDLPKDATGVTILHIAFSKYGFNPSQLTDIVKSGLGKKISCGDWSVYNDRQHFILLKEKDTIKDITITNVGSYTLADGRILELEYANNTGIPFENNPFPLTIRRRKGGDKFKPQGMKGKSKSIKKYISDLKLSIEEKQRILILEKDDSIISVVGLRNSQMHEQPKFYLNIKIQ